MADMTNAELAKEIRRLIVLIKSGDVTSSVETMALFLVKYAERIAAALEADTLRPISEAPKDGTDFIGWAPDGVETVHWCEAEGSYPAEWWATYADQPSHATYFRPLLSPAKDTP